jgi:hypothetical protein
VERGNGAVGVISNPSRGAVLGNRIGLATSFWSRLAGLQLAAPLKSGEGLWLRPTGSVHTCFMRCRLDLAFLDRRSVVVDLRANVGPWRVVLPVRTAHSCLELPSGTLAQSETRVGDMLVWEAYPDAERVGLPGQGA